MVIRYNIRWTDPRFLFYRQIPCGTCPQGHEGAGDQLRRALTLAKIACSTIKKHSSSAVTTLGQEELSLPLVLTSEEMVPLMSTPKKEPNTLPTPPVRSVPPMTAEEMASISRPRAW